MPIVGHSLGGITAAYVSQRRPDLVPALFMEDPPLFFGDKAVFDATPFAIVFPLMQAAINGWQADGASAEQIAAAMAALPSMSGQGTMGDENTPDALAATGTALTLLDPTVFDPVLTGESLGQLRPDGADPVARRPAAAGPGARRGVLRRPRRAPGRRRARRSRSSACTASATSSTTR